MKKNYFFLFFICSILSFSQSLQEKYDNSFGIFELKFNIDENGHANFQQLEQIQCENCSEKLIKKLNKETIKSFNKNRNYYQEKYSKISNGKKMSFNLPIVFKIKDLEK